MEVFSPPTLRPLSNSHEYDGLEADVKRLAIDLITRMRSAERDVNVSGAPHLGSFTLVERRVKADGLALYRRGDEPAMRYLYRAWVGRNPKRGLHFLRAYLQLLWPNSWSCEQLWQAKNLTYPNGLAKESELGANPEITHFITNRVEVRLTDPSITPNQLLQVLRPLRSTLGAKFLLIFRVENDARAYNTEEAGSPLYLYNVALPEATVIFAGAGTI